MTKAVLLLAHGAPRQLDEVEEYVLHIRHGRPLAENQMADIKDRYRQVGGSPLLDLTLRQAKALEERILLHHAPSRVYVGMRHSHPFITDVIQQMMREGVDSLVAVCMAPQYSSMTIGAYKKALDEAVKDQGLQVHMVGSFARHPELIGAFSARLKDALEAHPQAHTIFTAHSLPERVLLEGDPYDFEVKETARLTAIATGLNDWSFAYQSQGMTSDKWLGPTVESRLDTLAGRGIRDVVVAPIGFVCDNVEILYDVDIAFRELARAREMSLHRTASLNDSSEFISLLYSLVREHL